ncbi:lytic transglycosylase domain-containing protein, partial [Streptomyces polyrhachis]
MSRHNKHRKPKPPRHDWRGGVVGSAVAVAGMVVLTGSQGPATFAAQHEGDDPAGARPQGGTGEAYGNTAPYHTDLPPLSVAEAAVADPRTIVDAAQATFDQSGIPATVLDAYRKAERVLATQRAQCHLPWQLLAAIGKVESGHARGGRVDTNGTTLKPIVGPRLDGGGFARITDTDGGAYDGDATYDRAVGPMQFIPSTWARWGKDGNGDRRTDPNNIYDAALAAGHYLCASGSDLRTSKGLRRAILSYNHSDTYVRTVLAWLDFYRKGTRAVPDGTAPLPTTSGPGNPNPADDRPRDEGQPPIVVGPTPDPTPEPTPTEPTPTEPTPTEPTPTEPTPTEPTPT